MCQGRFWTHLEPFLAIVQAVWVSYVFLASSSINKNLMQNVVSNTGQDKLLLSDPLQAGTAMRHSDTTPDNETISARQWGGLGRLLFYMIKGERCSPFSSSCPECGHDDWSS